MQYRSSVRNFAKALLAEAARYEGGTIRDFALGITEEKDFRTCLTEWLSNERLESMRAVEKTIPVADWDEITDYFCRYHDAYGFTLADQRGQRPSAFLPWLASVAICALEDIGN